METGGEAIIRGTGKRFANLVYPGAEAQHTRLRFAHAINGLIKSRRPTQGAAVARMGVNQPKMSSLVNYRVEDFSVERLLIFLAAHDLYVKLVLNTKPRPRATGKITVSAA